MFNDIDQLVVPSPYYLFYFETPHVSGGLCVFASLSLYNLSRQAFVSVSLLVCVALYVGGLVLLFSYTLSSSCHSRLIFYFDTLPETFHFLVIIVLSPTVIYSLRKALFSFPTVIFIPPVAHCFQNIVT